MQRRVQEDSSPPTWCGPAVDGYKFDGFKLYAQGASEKRYRLDSPAEWKRIFSEYQEIRTESDAVRWVKLNGLPAFIPEIDKKGEEELASILNSARLLRGAQMLLEAYRWATHEQDLEPLKELLVEQSPQERAIRMFSELVEFGHPSMDFADNRAYAKFLSNRKPQQHESPEYDYLQSIVAKPQKTLKPFERRYLEEIESRSQLLTNEISLRFKDTNLEFYSSHGCLFGEPIDNRIFRRRTWERSKDSLLVEFARSHLTALANIMLNGVQPWLEWQYDPSTGKWSVLQNFKVGCPWHAIASEFAKKISNATIKYDECPHPKCKKIIPNHKRKDARHCGSARCDKWVQRNLPSIRKFERGKAK